MDLSVIIPFAGEYPQVLFTIRATAEILKDSGIEFEIIAVDNYCSQLVEQQTAGLHSATSRSRSELANEYSADIFDHRSVRNPELVNLVERVMPKVFPYYEPGINRSGAAIEAAAKGHDWLKYVKDDKRLSHWHAKRVGVEEASGHVFLFLDAHTVPSCTLTCMYRVYTESTIPYHVTGTMHMPLTYKILEYRRLIYKLKIENEHYYSYSFTPCRYNDKSTMADLPVEVPVMSTCGMMISREVYERVGGWPESLGIYGGGENFMNYTLGVIGMTKWIYPSCTLYHHGEKRDYHYQYDDLVYNRMLAHYLFGGEKYARNFAKIQKGDPKLIESLLERVFSAGKEQRELIKYQQQCEPIEFVKSWEGN